MARGITGNVTAGGAAVLLGVGLVVVLFLSRKVSAELASGQAQDFRRRLFSAFRFEPEVGSPEPTRGSDIFGNYVLPRISNEPQPVTLSAEQFASLQ